MKDGRWWFIGVVAVVLLFFFSGRGFPEEKGEVVVTATRTPHPLEDLPFEASVITREEIERSSAQTVSDLLRYLPGIFIRDEDAPGITAWRSLIRGLSFNEGYGLILVDGERVRGEGMGDSGIGLNQIPPALIERIEVVRGPSSVLYGSDALAGVVNIITREVPERPTYGFSAGYGSYDTNLESLYWGTREGHYGVLLQAAREASEMGAYGVRSSRDEDYERKTLITRLTYDLRPNVKLGLKIEAQEEIRERDYRTQDTYMEQKGWKYRFSPYVKLLLPEDAELTLRAYYYDWKFKGESRGSDPYPYALYRGDMYYRVIEARYLHPVGDRHLITLGGEYRNEELDYTFSHRKMDLTSLYVQDEIEEAWDLPLNLYLGVRLDHHSVYGTEVCPKVGFLWKMASGVRIRGSVGRGFKAPTIRQAFYTEPYPHGDYFYVSNPDLEAETSWGYSLGLEKDWGERFHVSFTLFRNDVRDMIIRYYTYRDIDQDGTAEKIRTFRNARKAYTQGIETALKMEILKERAFLNLSYTYTDTEDRDTGKELTFVPHHNLASHLVLKHPGLGLTLDLGFQFVSEMYTDPENTEETRSYSLVDLKLIKHLGAARLSLEGNNIFDSDYGEPDREWWGATWLVRLSMDW